MILPCLALLFLAPLAATADQQNEGDSPSGKLHYELRGGDDDEKEIWISEKGKKQNAVRLTDTPGWGNMVVYFSPDDYWIVVQDGGASLGVSLTLFRREKGAHFSEVKNADIDGKAEETALRQKGLPAEQISDHRYASLVSWSGDSKYILIQVRGGGKTTDRKTIVWFEWLGIYDLAKGVFIDDLKKFNRAAVTTERIEETKKVKK